MAAFDEQKAAVQAAIDQVKSDAAAKISAAEQRATDAEKSCRMRRIPPSPWTN